jgi:hypothetical protein
LVRSGSQPTDVLEQILRSCGHVRLLGGDEPASNKLLPGERKRAHIFSHGIGDDSTGYRTGL